MFGKLLKSWVMSLIRNPYLPFFNTFAKGKNFGGRLGFETHH